MLEREPDGAGWRVTFRASGLVRYLPAAFLAVWLCGWVVGEYFALGLLAGALRNWLGASFPLSWLPEMHGSPPSGGVQVLFGAFLLVWLSLWTFGGLVALAQLLQLLFGHEIVRVDGDALVVERRAPFPLSVSRMSATDIRGFRMRARTVHADTRRRAVPITQFTTAEEGAELMALLESWRRSYSPASDALAKGDAGIASWLVVTDESGAPALSAGGRPRTILGLVLGAIGAVMLSVLGSMWLTNVGWTARLGSLLLVVPGGICAYAGGWLLLVRETLHPRPGAIERRRVAFGRTWTTVFAPLELAFETVADSDGDLRHALRISGGGNRQNIASALNDPNEPLTLGGWLSERTGVPLTSARVADEARKAG